jgi:hypothetical protein
MGWVARPTLDLSGERGCGLGRISGVGHDEHVDVAVLPAVPAGGRPVDTDESRCRLPRGDLITDPVEHLAPQPGQHLHRRSCDPVQHVAAGNLEHRPSGTRRLLRVSPPSISMRPGADSARSVGMTPIETTDDTRTSMPIGALRNCDVAGVRSRRSVCRAGITRWRDPPSRSRMASWPCPPLRRRGSRSMPCGTRR